MTALFCHGRLAQDRPHPRYLTEFYLCIAAGGVLGGLFNVLIAPMVFNSLVEYPLALVLACLFLPRIGSKASTPFPTFPNRSISRGRVVDRASFSPPVEIGAAEKPLPMLTRGDLWLPLALGLLMIVLAVGLEVARIEALWVKATLLMGLPAAIGYTFIGRPVRFALGIGALLLVGGISRGILHSQVHQERSFFGVMTVMDKPAENESPTTFRYFVHGDTNHGQQNLDPERHREPLAYYFRTGPIGQLFDSLSKGPAKKRVAVLGLGAGALACYAEENQDWTFYEIDPAVESIARSYFTFLQDAEDRTNRYVDLEPVLGTLASHAGLICVSQKEDARKLSKAEEIQGKVAAHWVVMARTETDLGTLMEKPAWRKVPPGPAEWTDDYSNLLGAFRW